MSQSFTVGATVRITDREPIAADEKSGLFRNHFRGLTGKVAKVYSDGSAAVTVDPASLPDDIRKRHEVGSEKYRVKWIEQVSEEARGRLSAEEKKFGLNYSILVAVTDLLAIDAPPQQIPAPAPTRAIAAPAPELANNLFAQENDTNAAAVEAPRKTLAELEAEEAKHLEELKKSKGG